MCNLDFHYEGSLLQMDNVCHILCGSDVVSVYLRYSQQQTQEELREKSHASESLIDHARLIRYQRICAC